MIFKKTKTRKKNVPKDSNEDLTRTHHPDDRIAAPSFIKGDSAEIVFSKRSNYAKVGGKKIKIFESSTEAWEDACYDAAVELSVPHDPIALAGDRVTEKAKELIGSLNWWTDIY